MSAFSFLLSFLCISVPGRLGRCFFLSLTGSAIDHPEIARGTFIFLSVPLSFVKSIRPKCILHGYKEEAEWALSIHMATRSHLPSPSLPSLLDLLVFCCSKSSATWMKKDRWVSSGWSRRKSNLPFWDVTLRKIKPD